MAGPHVPFDVTKVEHADHPAIKDMPNNGAQGRALFEPQACGTKVWVNQHGKGRYGKGKVFATTIGHHNNSTKVSDGSMNIIAFVTSGKTGYL